MLSSNFRCSGIILVPNKPALVLHHQIKQNKFNFFSLFPFCFVYLVIGNTFLFKWGHMRTFCPIKKWSANPLIFADFNFFLMYPCRWFIHLMRKPIVNLVFLLVILLLFGRYHISIRIKISRTLKNLWPTKSLINTLFCHLDGYTGGN